MTMKPPTAILLVLLPLAAGLALADDTGSIEGSLAHRHVNHVYPAVVYIERLPGRTFEAPAEAVVVDQVDQKFVPRVTAVQVGGEVLFKNSDSVTHNVRSARSSVQEFDVGDFGPGRDESLIVEEPGVIELGCRVHSAMIAYLVVVETPWHATTDRRARFSIADVPPGTYRLTFWHEKFESQTVTVRVEAGQTAAVEFRDLVRKK